MRAFERFLPFQPITFAELSNRRERRRAREREKEPPCTRLKFHSLVGGRSTRFNGVLSDAAPPWITYDDPKRYRNVVRGKTLISRLSLLSLSPLDAFHLCSLRNRDARIASPRLFYAIVPRYSIARGHATAKIFANDVNRGREALGGRGFPRENWG